MKNKMSKMRGFTLVELLIVIALIAILSVAVLATINPIEQSNKARDASFKNDAAEVLGALERYYASQNSYPWNMPNTADSDQLLASTAPDFGIVGVTGAGLTAPLIASSELKSSFASKKPFDEPLSEDLLYVYHNATSNSNYACYFPKATANRTPPKSVELKCLDIANTKILNIGDGCAPPTGDWSYNPSATTANVLCVPEGDIQ